MDDVLEYSQKLHEVKPNLASILDEYSEIERIYYESLEATGFQAKRKPGIKSTAEVTLLFRGSPSSADEWIVNEQVA